MITVGAENMGISRSLNMLFIEREDTKRLLRMDWLQKIVGRYKLLKERRTEPTSQNDVEIMTISEKVSERNQTIDDIEIKNHLKFQHTPKKRKGEANTKD